MSIYADSKATRKHSSTVEERTAKRREKFPLVSGFSSVPCPEIRGTAAVVQSATRGGVFVEYIDESGYAHAVPAEALQALGFPEPVAPKAPTPS